MSDLQWLDTNPSRSILYRCTNPNCKAEDHVRLFANEVPPVALNCWQCHAGMRMKAEDMRQRHIGMLPVGPDEKEK